MSAWLVFLNPLSKSSHTSEVPATQRARTSWPLMSPRGMVMPWLNRKVHPPVSLRMLAVRSCVAPPVWPWLRAAVGFAFA